MKKSSIIGGTMVLAALGGYGAWQAYKKRNPSSVKKMKKNMKTMSRNMENSIEDMM